MDFGRATGDTEDLTAITLEFEMTLLFAVFALHGKKQDSFPNTFRFEYNESDVCMLRRS